MGIRVENVKNFDNLHVSVKTLLTLFSVADSEGKIECTAQALAKYLKSTRQTVSTYIKDYVNSDIMKYKYSGSARLNPIFYYNGKPEDFARVCMEYENFKSDIKPGE